MGLRLMRDALVEERLAVRFGMSGTETEELHDIRIGVPCVETTQVFGPVVAYNNFGAGKFNHLLGAYVLIYGAKNECPQHQTCWAIPFMWPFLPRT